MKKTEVRLKVGFDGREGLRLETEDGAASIGCTWGRDKRLCAERLADCWNALAGIQNPAAIPEVVEALKRIANCTDAPDIDATGEWRFGLHCGVEDRDCQNRYDGADYGHTVGVEKALEWASNEAKYALSKLERGEQ